MSAPTNTATTLTTIGIREDLSNLIFRIAAEQTPFVSNIGRTKAKQTLHEWQTEALATPDATNAQLEGDDISTLDAPNNTTRVGNKTQIFRKAGGVSGTADAVDLAGRASEIARQKLLKGKEAMRDLEKRAVGNFASNSQSGATPRRMGGLLGYLVSNVSRGSGGSSGGFSSGDAVAATNGTQRTFTEDQLKTVMASAFNNGASPSQVYMSAADKQVFSSFTGIADIRSDASKGKTTIYGAADFYQSDFGLLAAIPHPYGLTRDAVFVDPEMAKLATLRPWNTSALSKTGDSDRFLLIGEFSLEVSNEMAHGVVADIN
jgi:hypothetical protein